MVRRTYLGKSTAEDTSKLTMKCVVLILLLFAAQAITAQSSNIRRIDFKNRTYSLLCGDADRHSRVRVRGGHFQGKKLGIETFVNVYEIVYGDVNDDRRDEAIALYMCGSGASYAYFRGLLFGMKGSKPVLLAEIEGGNKSDGGFESVNIRKKRIIVNRYQVGTAGIGWQFTATSTYRWRRGRLQLIGQPKLRKISN